ncbi:N-6 DNA methylase [uncultured Lactobacillus sp.]|uniref:N-6 DNA methylase n=1 Tax=uncultured Lactobacillus sp. TaxID=153152 RepID=UPI00260F9FA7|nr:N-6 DNA methylase [uncultured Lactobacillus sp.]
MLFDVKTVNALLDIDESYKAPERMLQLMLDNQKRVETFKKFLEISTNMEFDWFHEYFEDEQAERKSKKQDFTPQSIADLMTSLVGKSRNGTYYEPAAGTGGILITRWWNDRLRDPVHLKPEFAKNTGFSILTYDPRNYWYQAEEMSDRAIPFLLFNMAIRGMNGVVIQCNSLERDAKEAYFIRNDTDNWLGFSEIIKLPHTEEIQQEFDIRNWVKEFK